MNSLPKAPVTVLGLGPMGSALASTLVENGHPTTVWNRTASKAEPLVAMGATAAATVDEAVHASPLVIVNVIDYDAVDAILGPVAHELTGMTVVNLTNDSPDRARAMARWANDHGFDYLDGSIMTPTESIGRPEAVFLYSGSEELYEKHRDTLSTLGGTASYLGSDPGRAASFDVALLDIFWTGMTGVAHSFALARAEGITPTEFLPFAQGIVELVRDIAPEIAKHAELGEYPGDDSNLISTAAGLTHIIHAAQARNVDASVLRSVVGLVDQVIQAGHGGDSFSRMVEAFSR
ncbi:NAD(P)-dependent oxidoreductase [Phytoactinopolyspora mesophila]|uniref:NAD(P)-dependent oxidoreductase n=1 Tax=Phytoactinopolyspora mesophila TaxID=2650750 RepID=A0A7K3LYP3_9ACTN|nr:NAD(P)-binding domain-containing protein [Phytoactinopolyspora mesophila]NDL55937.1 NAD(P)-dependent oxidoreductase [Phytoactinopolyspora mesophila]